MADRVALADRIRAKIDLGFLPVVTPEKLHAGYGQGLRCDGCDEPIAPAQLEYELPYPGERTVRFHQGCLGLWEGERRRRGISDSEER